MRQDFLLTRRDFSSQMNLLEKEQAIRKWRESELSAWTYYVTLAGEQRLSNRKK
jgi:hypothetical protein